MSKGLEAGRATYRDAPPSDNSSAQPGLPSGVWNFLSWTPVKTRQIIPNSLDKCLLRGGCAADFYQTFESIAMCFEKAPLSY